MNFKIHIAKVILIALKTKLNEHNSRNYPIENAVELKSFKYLNVQLQNVAKWQALVVVALDSMGCNAMMVFFCLLSGFCCFSTFLAFSSTWYHQLCN